MTDQILRKPQVLMAIGMGNTWLYSAIARGQFPRPVKLGSRAVGWRKSEVEAWLAELDYSSENSATGDGGRND